MPFLAPVVGPAIGAAKAAVGALGGSNPYAQAGLKLATNLGASYLGDKLIGNSGVPDFSNILQQQSANLQQGRQIAGQLQPHAQRLLSGATQSFSPVADYWSGLLKGGRGQLTNLLAPEISEINESYRAPTQAAADLHPRGGARASLMAQLPYQRSRDMASLFQQARPQAASGLSQTGQYQGQLGGNLYNSILSALSGSTQVGSSLMEYELRAKEQRYNESKALGGTIFDLLGDLPIFSKDTGGLNDDMVIKN